MRNFLAALVVAVMMMASGSANATTITGSINFIGFEVLTGPVSPVNVSNATGLHFLPAFVGVGTGTYTGIPSFTPVTFQDFTFSPFAAPVTSLWSLNSNNITYSFDLLSVQAFNTPSNTLTLNGTGILHVTNLEDAIGLWTLTTQQDFSPILTFSAASTVPEPGTMVLLGFGMLGLAIYGKRRMNKTA